ncbi:hypothetical protein AC249_AIPGENE9583 [Exaiptasia diaphana]|nr:hypothetical protein AC249_AIPGENE9583 [Exaiptasia diaphana]
MTDQNTPAVEEATNDSPPRIRQHADMLNQPCTSGTGQPGLSNTLAEMNSSMRSMATLLERIASGGAFGRQERRRELSASEDEDEHEEPPPKRRREEDELSVSASDQDIDELIHPPSTSGHEKTTPNPQADNFIKSLEAEYVDNEPLGPKPALYFCYRTHPTPSFIMRVRTGQYFKIWLEASARASHVTPSFRTDDKIESQSNFNLQLDVEDSVFKHINSS